MYHALSVHLSRAKLIARFDDRYFVVKFCKSEVWSKIPEESTLIFGDAYISSLHSVVEEAKNRAKTSPIRSTVSIEH